MHRNESHADWNDLAVLVEEGPDAVPAAVLEHLASCAACTAAWGEACRIHDAGLAGDPAPVPRPAPARRRVPPLAWLAGSLAAAVLVLMLALPPAGDRPGPADPREGLRTRLSLLSGDGPVYPGAGFLPATDRTRYRAGGDPAAAPADALLQPWADRFAADPADSDAAFWLTAGHLAADRPNFADEVVRRALQKHPGAVDLRHLEAITAYRLNELDRAEAILRDLLRERPGDDLARFNLALIRCETGRAADALPELRRMAAAAGSTVLRERARDLLERYAP